LLVSLSQALFSLPIGFLAHFPIHRNLLITFDSS
jgi:hypothetical protein